MSRNGDTTLNQLRYFAALADDLHFGNAAARLGISQPALTRQIQSLERFVGAPLLTRTQRSVALTPAGVVFANRTRETLRHHERSIETARNIAERGEERLSIGFESCAPFHDFPEVVLRFLKRYPKVRVSSYEMPGPEQAEALSRHRIDIGFVHPPVPDGAQFAFEPVLDEPFVAALPAAHSLAKKKRVAVRDLGAERFVLFPRALAPGCYDAVQRICGAAGFAPDVVHESNGIALSLKLIPVLGAVTLFPRCVARQADAGVVFRELRGSVTTVTCGFLRRQADAALPVEQFLRMWRSYASRVSIAHS